MPVGGGQGPLPVGCDLTLDNLPDKLPDNLPDNPPDKPTCP